MQKPYSTCRSKDEQKAVNDEKYRNRLFRSLISKNNHRFENTKPFRNRRYLYLYLLPEKAFLLKQGDKKTR